MTSGEKDIQLKKNNEKFKIKSKLKRKSVKNIMAKLTHGW